MASPRTLGSLQARLERQPDGNNAIPAAIQSQAIHGELDRILASPLFRSSKRNCGLLKHVVERALEGRAEDLKERSIGIDVFGREADYDTNADHIVRSVAGEVRRRLAQYYMEAGAESEVRIELMPGSYVPQFRLPTSGSSLAPAPTGAPAPTSPWWKWWAALWGALGLAVLAGAFGVRAFRPSTPFEAFWRPFLASPNAALICVGGGGQPAASTEAASPGPEAPSIMDFERQPSRRMHTSDALALANIAAMLQSSGKPYRVLNRAGSTSFRDLQSGPFVLIGGMNNEWTLRLTSGLRFGFERLEGGARVVDRQNPSARNWTLNFSAPIAQFTDYAIISRLRDPRTEQIAVVVAGIGSWGTLAAGEFVSHPEHLAKLAAFAPRRWEQKNVQVVISTDVIRGSSGPPNVVAVRFW